ncbi:MAG: P-loop NTPase [Bradymonadia bacterium]
MSGDLQQLPWHPPGQGPYRVVFAGGKGGVGRSLVLANIGVYLSRLGREVVVADLDPGGGNLHTYLGLEPLLPAPGALLRSAGEPLVEQVPGLTLKLCRPPTLISGGAGDALRKATLDHALSLEADVVLLDMGTHGDRLTLDTFLEADAAVVMVKPEPVGVERIYAFLRVALYHLILGADDVAGVVARAVLSADHVGQIQNPYDLINALGGSHPEAAKALRTKVDGFCPRIMVNQCRTRADMEMAAGICSALKRRWGVMAENLGHMDYDDAAIHSMRMRRPLMLEYPGSSLGQRIERVSRRLLVPVSRQREVRAREVSR